MTGAAGRHTATATSARTPEPATARSRWLARLALVLAAMAAVVPLAAAGLRGSLGLALVGVVAVAVALAAAWWFLTHRGLARTIAAVVVVVAPVVLIVILVRAGLLWVVIVTAALWAASAAAARAAFGQMAAGTSPVEYATPPPPRPFLIMNPKSGGGKVVTFDLPAKARALGAEVVLLDAPGTRRRRPRPRRPSPAAPTCSAWPAGTGHRRSSRAWRRSTTCPSWSSQRGRATTSPSTWGWTARTRPRGWRPSPTVSSSASTWGPSAGSTFVNNASFGAYAAVVQSQAYRDDKVRTTLDMLPDLLTQRNGAAPAGAGRRAAVDGTERRPGEQQLLRRRGPGGPRPARPVSTAASSGSWR